MRVSLASPDWEAADAAPGGVAPASYAGRPDVLGRINPGGSRSLLLNGHEMELDEAHQRVHGTPPRRVVMGSTTDARY